MLLLDAEASVFHCKPLIFFVLLYVYYSTVYPSIRLFGFQTLLDNVYLPAPSMTNIYLISFF